MRSVIWMIILCILLISIDLDMLEDEVNEKEMNLLYVSQDNIYEIVEYIFS